MKIEYDPLDESVNRFWHQTFKTAMEERILLKDLSLPLARIKRLMKIEEGVRMVASEVPVLFSMITEKFIEELTLRAWMNTEENKRRILQKSDLTSAVKTSEMYDFLIYIVPRNDLSRPFNQLMPNNVHTGHNGFASRGPGMYMKQPVPDERDITMDGDMINSVQGSHNPQDFYMQQEHKRVNHGSNEISTLPDAHMAQDLHMNMEYSRNFDIAFNRDMNLDLPADIIPRSFN